MSVDPAQNVPQGPLAPPDEAAAGVQALMHAITELAQKAGGVQSAAEAKDFMQGALFAAQTLITLDPSRLQGGDTPEARKASVPPRLPPTKDGNHDGRIGS